MESELERPRARALQRAPLIALLLGFVASRIAWESTGIPFRSNTMEWFAQFLDPPLLADRLLESLWHLHAQPPLLNAVAGLALKLAPESPGPFLHALHLVASLATCVAVWGALRVLGLGRWPAVGLALAFVSAPVFVVYEHWFFYPHLSATLLAGAAACFLLSRGAPGRALAAGFWLAATLVWLRSLFHPLWFLLVVATAILFAPAARRARTLRLAAAPAALVLLLAVKNLVLFGFFGTSSWGGNSLHRMMTESVERPVIEAMVERGDLTPLSLEWEFSKPEVYLELLDAAGADRGVPALDTTGKTRARQNAVNYNHWVYPEASRVYLRGAMRLLREQPDAYLRSLRWTSQRFLDPVTDDGFVRAIAVRVRWATAPFDAIETNPLVRLFFLGAVVYLGVLVFRGGSREERLFVAFTVGTIAWVAATGVALEYGENNRFRYQITPLLFLAAVVTVRDGVERLRRRRRRREA